MNFPITAYSPDYIDDCLAIWNEVVRDGIAFPQEEELTEETGLPFFSDQSFIGQIFYGFFKTRSGNELEKLLKDATVIHSRTSALN